MSKERIIIPTNLNTKELKTAPEKAVSPLTSFAREAKSALEKIKAHRSLDRYQGSAEKNPVFKRLNRAILDLAREERKAGIEPQPSFWENLEISSPTAHQRKRAAERALSQIGWSQFELQEKKQIKAAFLKRVPQEELEAIVRTRLLTVEARRTLVEAVENGRGQKALEAKRMLAFFSQTERSLFAHLKRQARCFRDHQGFLGEADQAKAQIVQKTLERKLLTAPKAIQETLEETAPKISAQFEEIVNQVQADLNQTEIEKRGKLTQLTLLTRAKLEKIKTVFASVRETLNLAPSRKRVWRRAALSALLLWLASAEIAPISPSQQEARENPAQASSLNSDFFQRESPKGLETPIKPEVLSPASLKSTAGERKTEKPVTRNQNPPEEELRGDIYIKEDLGGEIRLESRKGYDSSTTEVAHLDQAVPTKTEEILVEPKAERVELEKIKAVRPPFAADYRIGQIDFTDPSPLEISYLATSVQVTPTIGGEINFPRDTIQIRADVSGAEIVDGHTMYFEPNSDEENQDRFKTAFEDLRARLEGKPREPVEGKPREPVTIETALDNAESLIGEPFFLKRGKVEERLIVRKIVRMDQDKVAEFKDQYGSLSLLFENPVENPDETLILVICGNILPGERGYNWLNRQANLVEFGWVIKLERQNEQV